MRGEGRSWREQAVCEAANSSVWLKDTICWGQHQVGEDKAGEVSSGQMQRLSRIPEAFDAYLGGSGPC